MIVAYLIDVLKADTAVAAIVGDRIYPMSMPDAPLFPLIVVSRVGGPGSYDFQGDAGIEQARLQFDHYHDGGYAACIELKTASRRLLSGFPQTVVSPAPSTCVVDSCMVIQDMDMPTDPFEAAGPSRLRRRMLECYVWNKGL